MVSNTRSTINVALRLLHPHREPFDLKVSTAFPSTGVTAIFGSSGAGKSTLLRCVAGLEKNAVTEIEINGIRWSSKGRATPVHKRRIGMVFQDSRLLPHLSGLQNLELAQKFGEIRKRKLRDEDRDAATPSLDETIELLELDTFVEQRPNEMSGGEAQRVAIARAIVGQPQLLLMDEPLASLGENHKAEIIPYIERLNKSLGLPTLYVTHSIREISRIADHLLVLEKGALIESGSSSSILETGSARFFEDKHAAVVIKATVIKRLNEWHLICAVFDGGQLWLEDNGETVGERVLLQIAAKDVSLMTAEPADTSIQNRIEATIKTLEPKAGGAHTLVHLNANGTRLIAALTRRAANQLALKPGDKVWAMVKAVALIH